MRSPQASHSPWNRPVLFPTIALELNGDAHVAPIGCWFTNAPPAGCAQAQLGLRHCWPSIVRSAGGRISRGWFVLVHSRLDASNDTFVPDLLGRFWTWTRPTPAAPRPEQLPRAISPGWSWSTRCWSIAVRSPLPSAPVAARSAIGVDPGRPAVQPGGPGRYTHRLLIRPASGSAALSGRVSKPSFGEWRAGRAALGCHARCFRHSFMEIFATFT